MEMSENTKNKREGLNTILTQILDKGDVGQSGWWSNHHSRCRQEDNGSSWKQKGGRPEISGAALVDCDWECTVDCSVLYQI